MGIEPERGTFALSVIWDRPPQGKLDIVSALNPRDGGETRWKCAVAVLARARRVRVSIFIVAVVDTSIDT